jgi:hypothetical protein
MRQYTGQNINYFRSACEQIAFGGAGDFMVSPGDIDPPGRTYAAIQRYIGPGYTWYPVAGNHETETPSDMDWLRVFNRDGNTLQHIVNEGPAGCTGTLLPPITSPPTSAATHITTALSKRTASGRSMWVMLVGSVIGVP